MHPWAPAKPHEYVGGDQVHLGGVEGDQMCGLYPRARPVGRKTKGQERHGEPWVLARAQHQQSQRHRAGASAERREQP